MLDLAFRKKQKVLRVLESFLRHNINLGTGSTMRPIHIYLTVLQVSEVYPTIASESNKSVDFFVFIFKRFPYKQSKQQLLVLTVRCIHLDVVFNATFFNLVKQ